MPYYRNSFRASAFQNTFSFDEVNETSARMLEEVKQTRGESAEDAAEYVTRNMTPSGWAPSTITAEKIASLGFSIKRSTYGNLPVYRAYKNGNTKVIIVIRNIQGDVSKLTAALMNDLQLYDISIISDTTIEVQGEFFHDIVDYLYSLGF
jgi:translation initiation factor 1 (eIF-1/SUI1)